MILIFLAIMDAGNGENEQNENEPVGGTKSE